MMSAREAWWIASLHVRRLMICARIEWLRIVIESDPLWAHTRVAKLDRDGRRLIRDWRGE
jgi:hypothetical protein